MAQTGKNPVVTLAEKGSWWRMMLAVITSLVLVGISIWVVVSAYKNVERQRDLAFEKEAEAAVDLIGDRVTYLMGQVSGMRSFLVSTDVNSTKWRDYILATDVETKFPEAFSFVYAERVERKNLDEFVKKLKKQEAGNTIYENYVVFPETPQEEMFPVKYLYTQDTEMTPLLGYDLVAIEKAAGIESEKVVRGEQVVSDLIYLKSMVSSSNRRGYAFILPVFTHFGMLEQNPEEKLKYFTGFFAAWISPEKLFGANMVDTPEAVQDFSVFDNSNEVWRSKNRKFDGVVTKKLRVFNKEFVLEFKKPVNYRVSGFGEAVPLMVLFGVVGVNLMWYLTLLSVWLSRRSAVWMAMEATKDLNKFKQAVEGVSDHVVITDVDGRILYANKAVEGITGFSRSEIIGKTPALWGGLMEKEFYEKMWKVIKINKQPYYGELRNKRKNGEIYDAEIHVSPIVDEKGDLAFFVGIERDVSKVKAVDRMKTEFLSIASHQLRTPLSAVKWFGRMLLDGDAGKLSKEQKKYVEQINQSNDREIQRVNALLNVSRIESGRIVVTPKETDFYQLIDSVISELSVGIENEKKKISFSRPKRDLMINIDPDLIQHVLSNLISNALRYSASGQIVRVEVEIEGKIVKVSVVDKGIGIPEEQQQRVFDKFFRATNALKVVTDGSGLGLYLVKTIILSSGGQVGFISEENKGSTFWFTLPLSGMEKKEGEVKLS